ncbi:HAD family hydrolase [Acinetobacter sp. Leaf130]|uniref:HAD family hydrolase n=1 Tax=Acinetobacter sp. Leaf130 TaxID=1736269 RepID=UPI0006FF3985|nr:HAD family hydrolase [Acinetobacter sp. Leaf130]KQQ68391.1 HAD family hydrolase [Acinetobacter sp. Leaf130]
MIMRTKALVLDLDDTLYSELDYLKSAYYFIANKISDNPLDLFNRMLNQYFQGLNVFSSVSKDYQVDRSQLLDWYRFHQPNIQLYPDVLKTLLEFSPVYKYGMITDGRSKTQRNKIAALGLESLLESIVISEEINSEKPNLLNYKKIIEDLSCEQYIYIGDNLKKDFITAKRLGWITIGLRDQGKNIHQQDFSIAEEYQAHHYFNSWMEINQFLTQEFIN